VKDDNRFPYDIGNFFANFMLKSLPPDQKIDIKKTKYKKFNNFLHQMNEEQNEWVVKMINKKGIDLIQEVWYDL
jgi:hypothetical protein